MSRTTSSINKHGSIASAAPQLAAEWDYSKNQDMHPAQVSVFSNRYAWWKCSEGHGWRAQINSRYSGSLKCKTCQDKARGLRMMAEFAKQFGSIASLPIALHWDHEMNLPYAPDI